MFPATSSQTSLYVFHAVSSLEDDLKTFWRESSDGNLCDITMMVGDTHIRAHKVAIPGLITYESYKKTANLKSYTYESCIIYL